MAGLLFDGPSLLDIGFSLRGRAMRGRKEVEGFSPWDLNNLQECFETVLAARHLAKGSEEAENIASALIIAYQKGVRDRDELIRLADLRENR